MPQRVIVIPAYLESDALPILIAELVHQITDTDLIIVVDDSPTAIAAETAARCRVAGRDRSSQLHFETSGERTGRGGAVRRAFQFAYEEWTSVQWFVECDADGSHRVDDIRQILNASSPTDLLIGSRYTSKGQIIGWTVSRRLQSRVLNFFIPRMLGLRVNDITNGLRRYSRAAIGELLKYKPESSTFIYLTEQALIIHRAGLKIGEVPITFEERRAGVSSVTWRELRASLNGLIRIAKLRKFADVMDAK